MRKLLSLVLAFAMILGLFAFPVSADATTYQQVGQELVGLGVLKGVDAKGTLAEMQNLTREQALVVLTRLMGQEDKALATDAQPGFTDVPAAHWYSPYVAYAKLQGWTTGVSETEFGLGQSVTTKQVVTLMMRALGYEADWAKEDIMKKAKELGLLEGVSATADDAIIRGELFIVMKNTLYTKPMGEKAELIYKLGLAENPIPATLEVVDVKATNLKEIVVEFNQEVDKDTLEDAFSSVGLSLTNITAELQEDGKTVLLTLANNVKMTNKQNYKITISKVKSLSGVMMEKVVKEFKTEDNEVPKVEKLVVTGPKTFDIIFSEPVDTAVIGKVKMTVEGKTGPGVSVASAGSRRFRATVGTNMKDGTTYTVLVSGFQDYAKYKNIDTEMELEYAKVTDAPTVEVVKATQEYVVYKFNRPVKGLNKDNFYHTYSAWKPVALYESVQDMNADSNKNSFKVDPTKSVTTVVARYVRKVEDFVKNNKTDEHPLQVGDVEVNTLGQVGGRKVVDNWGNQLQDTELMVNITADKTAPVVESVETVGEKNIEIKFSKAVVYDRVNYEILSESGAKVSGLSLVGNGDGSKVNLTVGGVNPVGKTYILNIKNVRDNTINMNKLVGTESFNITFGDKSFKGVKEVYLKAPTKENEPASLFIVYRENMDAEATTDIKNYKFSYSNAYGAEQFSISADTSMYSDSVAQLTMSYKTWKEKFFGKTAYAIIANGVKDIAGNSFATFTSEPIPVKTASTEPKLITKKDGSWEPSAVVATDRQHVKFTFDQPLLVKDGNIDATKFVVNSGAIKVDSAVVDGALSNQVLLNIDPKQALPTDLKGVVIKYEGTDIENQLDAKLKPFTVTAAAKQIKDEINPEYNVVTAKNQYESFNDVVYRFDGTDHKILVTFTEPVNPKTVSNKTYVVSSTENANYAVKEAKVVGANKDQVEITLEPITGDDLTQLKRGLKASLEDTPVVVAQTAPTPDKNYYTYFMIAVNTTANAIEDEAGNELTNRDIVAVRHLKTDLGDLISLAEYADLKALVAKVDDFKTNDYENGAVANPPVNGKHYFNETTHAALKAALDTAYGTADGLVSVAADDKKVQEYKDAHKALSEAFDKVVENTIFVAAGMNTGVADDKVFPSKKTENFVSVAEVDTNVANYYYLTSNENDYFTQDAVVSGELKADGKQLVLLDPATEIDAAAPTHILLVKVEQNKVVAYKTVDLADKKGTLTTQANTLKLAAGTQPLTVEVGKDDLKALKGEHTVQLSAFDDTHNQFKLQYTQANANQTVTYQITSGENLLNGEDKTEKPVTTAVDKEFTAKAEGTVEMTVTLKETGKSIDQVINLKLVIKK